MTFIHSFKARYPGTCGACGSEFLAGDEIAYQEDEIVEVGCYVEPTPKKAQSPHGDCFTIHAGECL